MKTKFIVATLVFGLITACYGQDNKVTPLLLRKGIIDVSVDHQNNVFTSDISGNVNRYDKNWKVDLRYSPQVRSRFDNIDATSLKIYCFSKSQQQLTILDRFLSNPLTYDLQTLNGGFVGHFCRGMNNTVWLVDQSTYEIKNIDLLTGEVLASFFARNLLPKKSIVAIVSLSFQKNRLFIHFKNKGVFLFDNQGNLIREITMSAPEHISYHGNEIFYLFEKDLNILHLNQDLKESYTLEDKSLKDIKRLIRYGTSTLMLNSSGIYKLETQIGH